MEWFIAYKRSNGASTKLIKDSSSFMILKRRR
jgi:hypothetical protein